MKNRPDKISCLDDLQNYYWKKTDLIIFCKIHYLSQQGIKSHLIERIKEYLTAGNRIKNKIIVKQHLKDSLKEISKDTLVKNYNNDSATRKFFVKHIGKKFKFNAYLRQYTNSDNTSENLTYGDLISGWISFEENKSNIKHIISPQFEYNQFIKDYFTNEKEATLKSAISAWKMLASTKGLRTYNRFIELRSNHSGIRS